MKYIRNKKLQEFLEYNGVFPECEFADGSAKYKRTPLLLSLMDDYYIKYVCIPNKL